MGDCARTSGLRGKAEGAAKKAARYVHAELRKGSNLSIMLQIEGKNRLRGSDQSWAC